MKLKLSQGKYRAIRAKENVYTYREFWWIIVFNKSPYITSSTQGLITNIINNLQTNESDNKRAGDICGNLFVEFLKTNSKQFFEWNIDERDFYDRLLLKLTKEAYLKIIRKH